MRSYRSNQVSMQREGVLAVCCILIPLIVAACSGSKAAPSTSQIPEVSVVTVHKSSVPATMELPGRTSPVAVAQIRGRVDGIVLARDFKEGGDVRAHQR